MIRKILGITVAVVLFSTGQLAEASDAVTGADASTQNLDYTHGPGPDLDANDQPAGLGGGTTYLFIAGSAFTPRTSSQTVTYQGSGCTYSSAALTTSLELADFSEISGVRVFYYNTTPGSSVSLFLTTYDGAGGSSDNLTGNMTSSSGYASDYFSLATPLVVDQFASSMVLTATMSPGTRLCGMRVFYAP